MPIVITQPVEAGPRLKKFTRDECEAITNSGLIDVRLLDHKRWTVDEVEALRESGAIDVDRLELVEGELYDKMGRNRPHIIVVQAIARILYEVFGLDCVTTESSIQVGAADQQTSTPEPDISVTNLSFRNYRQEPPRPQDVRLIVEVSDTTVRYDLRIKAGLYARAGIIEYWVADLNGKKLIVHRQPANGQYASVVSYDINESVTPLAAPEHSVPVRSLFSE